MSYLQTVTEVEAAANTINPNGRFGHGRIVDASQAFNGDYPLIWLYPPNIDIPSPGAPEFLDDNILLIAFWLQDKPASSIAERQALIAQADTLMRAFLQQLVANKLIRIVGKIRAEPQYGMYNGTVSGMAMRLTYQNFAPCP